jgi:hypothetical protein
VLFKNLAIKDEFQEEPPLVSDETTSQKTKRVPEGLSSITRSRRRNIAEGTPLQIVDEHYPQRGWLSIIGGRNKYIFDSIGGEGSFVYVIDSGLNVHHPVRNFFRFVDFFTQETNFLTNLGIL